MNDLDCYERKEKYPKCPYPISEGETSSTWWLLWGSIYFGLDNMGEKILYMSRRNNVTRDRLTSIY